MYIPWWERPESGCRSIDFRPLIKSDGPLGVGKADRVLVAAYLGEPPLMPADGSAFGYTFNAVSGIRIFLPLFFLPMAADAHVYLLRVEFGSDGRVARYKVDQWVHPINDRFICVTGAQTASGVKQLNTVEPKLLYIHDLAAQMGPTTRPTR